MVTSRCPIVGRLLTASATAMLLLTMLLLGGAAGCNNAPVKPPPPGPAEVIVQHAVEKEFTDFEDFTGRLEAFKRVEIKSRAKGYLEKVNFHEGGKVKKDDVLFEIDPRPAKADLDKADASLVQAQAKLKRLEGDLTRAQELLRMRSISKEEYEKVLGDHAEAHAALGNAKANQASFKLLYEYTKVLAPISGLVGRAMIDEGNLVKDDDTILTTVVTQDPIYAYFDVDERTLLKLRRLVDEGTIKLSDASSIKVRMGLADEDNFPHEGKIDFQDNTIDPSTGTLRLRAVFANAKGFLAPGMFVRIRFQVGQPRVGTLVSEQGVGTDQGQKFVYVVTEKKEIEYRKVKTGALVQNLRVIEEGLKPGERIVVSGLQRVRPMAKVEPKLAEVPAVKANEAPKAVIGAK